MKLSRTVPWILLLAISAMGVPGWAQSFNGSIAGVVKDPSGAIVGGAEMILKNQAKGVELRRTSTDKGDYAFRNLVPGSYELRVNGAGFQPYLQKNIEVNLNADVRLDVSLSPRRARRSRSRWSPRPRPSTTTTGPTKTASLPTRSQQLPIQLTSGPRAAAAFVLLMPGVSSGGTGQRVRRPHQRRHAVGRRGRGGRGEHAAGLHEPERHDLDLPGLPLLPRHGERDQGRELELRAPVRLQHLRTDRGHHQIRAATGSTARPSTTTSATA